MDIHGLFIIGRHQEEYITHGSYSDIVIKNKICTVASIQEAKPPYSRNIN